VSPLATSAPRPPLLANANHFRNPNMVFESTYLSVRLPTNRCSQWHQSGWYLDRLKRPESLIDSSTSRHGNYTSIPRNDKFREHWAKLPSGSRPQRTAEFPKCWESRACSPTVAIRRSCILPAGVCRSWRWRELRRWNRTSCTQTWGRPLSTSSLYSGTARTGDFNLGALTHCTSMSEFKL